MSINSITAYSIRAPVIDIVVEYDDKDILTKNKEDADHEVKINSIEAGRYRSLLSKIQIMLDVTLKC